MDLIDIRVVLHYRFKLGLYKVMQFKIRQLLFKAAYHRSSKHNVANRAKSDDQELHAPKIKAKCLWAGHDVLFDVIEVFCKGFSSKSGSYKGDHHYDPTRDHARNRIVHRGTQ